MTYKDFVLLDMETWLLVKNALQISSSLDSGDGNNFLTQGDFFFKQKQTIIEKWLQLLLCVISPNWRSVANCVDREWGRGRLLNLNKTIRDSRDWNIYFDKWILVRARIAASENRICRLMLQRNSIFLCFCFRFCIYNLTAAEMVW